MPNPRTEHLTTLACLCGLTAALALAGCGGGAGAAPAPAPAPAPAAPSPPSPPPPAATPPGPGVAGAATQTRLSVGWGYTLALRADGTVLAWGNRMLGGSGTPLAGTTARVVGGLAGITAVRTTIGADYSFEHSLVIGSHGAVQGWGMNGDIGALGLPRGNARVVADAPVGLAGLGAAVQVEGCGSRVSAALRADGSIWILPTTAPFNGQPGSVTAGAVPGIVATFLGRGLQGNGVSLCQMHAVDTQGLVWLIDFTESSSLAGYQVTPSLSQTVSLPAVTAVQCSHLLALRHCLALGSDGRVWAWGDNGSGQLGDGSATNRTIPALVPGLSGIRQIAVNDNASFAVDAGGQLHSWGGSFRGRVDEADDTLNRVPRPVPGFSATREVAAGTGSGCALKRDGSVWCWGWNNEGLFGNGSSGEITTLPQQAVGINLN